ncbi:monovalent cation:proton antiporter family protein [Bacillus shivajii]|uniref:monovalent cation:proton antiporter family protein n=1 Tax=Bacillus shivajii TaxID=1983719 RepID=UPI001CFA0BB8|nr:monovalent cation:proton antiporter family protein [Bacillus shivajii]UCZ51943.1 monovalent cation:proton antiporter family protein [Bacillus shivajii]
MEEHAAVTSLVIVVSIAFLIPVLLHKLKLRVIPVVVAEIIAGIIIGKSGFNLVSTDIWLESLSLLGFIFLMFLSGLEIDFSAFANKKKKKVASDANPFVAATIIFIGVFGLSLLLSFGLVWLGFVDNAFLMTLIISTISLGVVVPTLKEANIMDKTIGQTILLVAVIADLVTMVLLAVFVSIYAEGGGNMWLLLILFAAGILIYWVAKKYQHRSFFETMTKGTIQIDTRAIFALIIFLVALSETVGAENILGAFLAGVLVSLLAPNKEMVKKLDSFGYGFVIPIFFVMVGVDLDLWALFSDSQVMLLIPLLLLALLISKVVPCLFLLKWYDWKTTIGAGFLLTSTLSLVIAAAAIGERIGVIDELLSSALILVAVLSCILTPIVFKKLFPRYEDDDVSDVMFVGANQLTMPLSLNLDRSRFKAKIFHRKQDKIDEFNIDSSFSVNEMADFSVETLEKHDVFEGDIIVVATGDEEKNLTIAKYAKELGIEQVIARVDMPEYKEELENIGVDVFSIFFSTQLVLKTLIESPHVVELFGNPQNGLSEVEVGNESIAGTPLREMPFFGDAVFVRIFRGNESIIPHGDTVLEMRDRLVVTGSKEHVNELRRLFEK